MHKTPQGSLTRLLLLAALMLSALLFAVGTAMATDGDEGHVCFYAMDQNRDGFVDAEEFQAAYGEDSEDMFAALDADHDGLLVHDEYHVAE